MPIRYSQNIPVMASAAQWVDHVLGVRHIDFDAFFHDFAFTKSEHWRYEKEWRCRILNANRTLDVPEMEDTWACPLLPEEVVAVYLGCRMESANRAAILDAMQSSLPSSEVHEAIKSPTRFALEFRRVLP